MDLGAFAVLCLIIGFPILLVWSGKKRTELEHKWEEELKTCSPERRKEIFDMKSSIKENDEWFKKKRDQEHDDWLFGKD